MHNVSAAVSGALHFHGTPEFVRLLQVMSLEGSPWAFLSEAAASGAPVPREALARRLSQDDALLESVVESASAAAGGSSRGAPSAAASFFVVLLTEAVGGQRRLRAESVRRVVPFVLQGLEPGSALEHHAGRAADAPRAALSPCLLACLRGEAWSAAEASFPLSAAPSGSPNPPASAGRSC